MKRFFARLSLQRKLHVLMLAAVSLALLITIVATAIYEVTTFQPRILQQTRQGADVLELVLQAPLEFEDQLSATRYLGTRSGIPTITIAAVYGRDGRLFAVYRRNDIESLAIPRTTRADQARFSRHSLDYWRTLNYGGHLYIKSELPPLYARLPQYGITVGAASIALFMVALLLQIGSQRNVLTPLRVLLDSAQRITSNNDYSIRAELDREDELGSLATAFNRMVEVVGERERRLRSLIENSSDMITVMAIDGKICFQSPSSRRILGYAAGEMLDRNGFEFVHSDDIVATQLAIESAFEKRNAITLSVRLRHADGSWRNIEAVGRALDHEIDGGVIIINARDVTDNLKLEEQFRQSQKLEAIGQLTGGVAHDFNNLLTIITGNAMLINFSEQLPAECRESLLEIERAANRAAELTRQLLTFSRRQSMELKASNLNQIVKDMMRMLHRLLGETIETRVLLAEQPVTVHADTGMMEQVLLNLSVNARDAMPKGGVLTIQTSLINIDDSLTRQMPGSRVGHFVCLQVGDNGSGIATDILPHIFEPFFTTKSVGKGTGLGLATVYGIVQQHQGWIACHSEPGQGTQFSVYLPQQVTELAATITHESKFSTATSAQRSATILLVEDEPRVRSLMRNVLAKDGYEVIEAESSIQALEIWESQRSRIELLITDLVIPGGMDGQALAARILMDSPDLPVIYASGYSAQLAGKDMPYKKGINFLAKPFDPQQLKHLVITMLRSTN